MLVVALAAHWQLSDGMRLPDPKVTPGVVRSMTLKELCGTKWGKDERAVTVKMKKEVCEFYGAMNCPKRNVWEVDHLISRELGGKDAADNLWPQPIKQARLKDRLENRLHREVCSGATPLRAAQEAIRTNWWAAYKARFK